MPSASVSLCPWPRPQPREPDELLDDPALESRAREVSKELRCLVCRNESIDDSNAELARDLRVLVRERIVAGDSDAEVKQFLVDRYGEFVLLNPRVSLANAFLWLAGPAMLILGGIVGWCSICAGAGRRPRPPRAPLTAQERAELDRLLGPDDPWPQALNAVCLAGRPPLAHAAICDPFRDRSARVPLSRPAQARA